MLIGQYESVGRVKLQEEWYVGVPSDFGQELFESDIERMLPALEVAAKRFPAFEQAPIVRTVAGPVAFTPVDAYACPLLGPVPRAPGLWLAAAFFGSGVVQAGGAGR